MQSTGIGDWELLLRLGAFVGVLAAMATWETLAPRRALLIPRRVRWAGNLGLVTLNALVVRLAFPVAAVGFAAIAAERGWGSSTPSTFRSGSPSASPSWRWTWRYTSST